MEQFSKDSEKILSKAESIAFSFNHGLVSSEHLLLAFLKDKEQAFTKELIRQKIDIDNITKKVKGMFSKKDKDPLYMEYTIELKLLISKASIITKERKEGLITPSILSFAMLIDESCGAYALLKKQKVNMSLLKENIFVIKKQTELDSIGDLHRLGLDNKDPLIGRKNELSQLINALSRRNKPNAILVGEPGVGKTAIVEELASLLEANKVPSLLGRRIYELDLASTVGGTKYRGEFEEKIKKILKKVHEDKGAILFIDEIHNIVHAGGAEGAIDASNILKPYLSRGDIQLIGATTQDEFESVFEKDKPLKRRFQVIKVYPTSKEETKEILYKIKPLYEDFYNTRINNEVIDEIVDLADIYLKDMHFPDKAIDVLDNTLVSCEKPIKKEDVFNTLSTFYKIEKSDNEQIEKVYDVLKEKVIGQDKAIEEIYNHLLEMNVEIKDTKRPLLSLMFLGPVGVGKSLACEIIAENLFGEDNVFTLNMSLYQDPYSLKELLSSNKGIYGEESSSFIKKIKTHPHLLLIIDEVDKANNEVLDFIHSILDRGGFFDLKGKYIDMHNAMIIMNSNYGFSDENSFSSNIKRDEQEKMSAKSKLLNRFRKEFLSRIDGIIEFSYLDMDSICKISQEYGALYDIDEKELQKIISIDKEYNKYGAFSIKRNIKKIIVKNPKKKILN